MAPVFDFIFEIIGEIVLHKIIAPIIKFPYALIRWLLSKGKIKFASIWKNPNSEFYGYLIWASAIIMILLYFIFLKK